MKLIVGLGNHGKKYEKTRHNLGFMVVEALVQMENGEWKMEKKFNSQLSIINSQLLLAKPQTLMNASGFAVVKLANFYKIKPEDLWVIHDDVDLPLGKLKIVRERGSAGHRGVISIIEQLGTTDFVRFRLGIGHPKRDGKWTEDFVLSPFLPTEKDEVKRLIKKTVEAIKVGLRGGGEQAIGKFN
jgi:PTH1 family peptidyl-tRNA hydrolase